MRHWYFPAWNGDIRLESTGPESVKLITHEPTTYERETLTKFFKKALKNGWITKKFAADVAKEISSKDYEIDGPIAEVGEELRNFLRPEKASITAFKFSDGKIEVTEAASVENAAKAKEAEEAASVRRPNKGCPSCVPGAVGPASEVLQAFMTPDQHSQWAKHRALIAVGNLTGHRYLIAHRNTEIAARQWKIAKDLETGGIIQCHDWDVPPEEEVLATKLILEHREHWLTTDIPGHSDPFPGFTMGLDNKLASAIGELVYGRPTAVCSPPMPRSFLCRDEDIQEWVGRH